VGGIFAAFILYVVLDGVVGWWKRRRLTARMESPQQIEQAGFNIPIDQQWSDYMEGVCKHCGRVLYLQKIRRYRPFVCENCHQLNPPLRKDILWPVKRFLRWLLYPSFQDRF
jgi:hypothetical protein